MSSADIIRLLVTVLSLVAAGLAAYWVATVALGWL
jgi:hypothetical protein